MIEKKRGRPKTKPDTKIKEPVPLTFMEKDEYELFNRMAHEFKGQFEREFKKLKGKNFTDSYMVLLKRIDELNKRLSEKTGTPMSVNSKSATHILEHLQAISQQLTPKSNEKGN